VRASITTILRQEIEVPDNWTRQDVFGFLAENQSFRDAFEGVSNKDQTARIVDVLVVEEEITELGEECFDA
jgi:predicted metalloendopeptidase